jgi:ribosomal protein S18 acetylase RimI-like enzyme
MVHSKLKSIRMIETTRNSKKKKTTLDILSQLSEWFHNKKAIQQYAKQMSDTLFYTVFDAEIPIGFIAIQLNNKFTAEIYVMGIDKNYHNKGIGESLIKMISKKLSSEGYRFLIVKTLDETSNYEPYESTRVFYRKCGFTSIGLFPEIWGKENPCSIMVKSLNPKGKKR